MTSWEERKKKKTDAAPVSSGCAANGCHLRATASWEGRPWSCRYHAPHDMKDWHTITTFLQQDAVVQLLTNRTLTTEQHMKLQAAIRRAVERGQ